MEKENNVLLYWAIAIFGVLMIFLFFGGGMMNNGYGFNGMCANMGGIWCYWPSFGGVIQVLVVIALVLSIIWIVRQLKQNGGRK